MKKIIHRANERGTADYGWLKANYYFSFANYYNPEKIHFGKLRVLNDDYVEAGMGFSPHPHNDMEIITIPHTGSVKHKDSTGGEGLISPGEVQVMSAGTGVVHSEFNGSHSEALTLFQIWIFPKTQGLQPRYDQKKFNEEGRNGKMQLVASNDGRDGSLMINQDAFLSLLDFTSGKKIEYKNYKSGNGIFMIVISGNVSVAGEKLSERDAIGISETDSIEISAESDSKLLFIEVPMN